jgi:hypothetical protein
MNIAKLFFHEQSLSKVAAVYDTPMAARSAARTLKHLPEMRDRQVQIVYGFDRDWGRKVEPEGVGIWRTAIRAHATCGTIGLISGLLLFAGLYGFGVTAVTTTPFMSLVAIVMFATIFGLIVGGLFTIRPDHDAVIDTVSDATRHGRCAVVVHPQSRQQFAAALRALGRTGAPVAHTL